MPWRARRVGYRDVARLRDALGCAEPVAWALVRRGLSDPEAARAFLDADAPLGPPGDLPGAAEAAGRLRRAVERSEPIVVHGDYDCDGITSTALLALALRARGGRVATFLPNRFSDGYGVAEATVERLAAEGHRLLVCVDCGTSADAALTRAVELGLDVIVMDHHLAGGRRPPGILVNPALGRGREDLPAAAGVVFTVLRALAEGDQGLLAPPPEDDIDLVALATVADAVPLIGENRVIVARGLRAMRDRTRPGLLALARAAASDPARADARMLGFTYAPAINASGRLGEAERGLELLMADEEEAARPVAESLWSMNLERRDIERGILEEALARVEASPPEQRDGQALVVAGEGWHEGVVGIVASRLAERFERPAIVIAVQEGMAKGSGRSVPGVDLHELVGRADGALTQWGGHAGAIGLQLPPERIPEFRADLQLAAEGARAAIARSRVRAVDAVVGGRDLTLAVAEEIERMAPFGRGNPEPLLVVPGCSVGQASTAGEGRHLVTRLGSGGVHCRGIGFGLGGRAEGLDVALRHDAVVELGVERWQDLVAPRVIIRGLDALDPGAASRRRGGPRTMLPDDLPGLALADVLAEPFLPTAPAEGTPEALVDLRPGAPLSRLVALAGSDGGAVAVVADARRRGAALESVLRPDRLDVSLVVVAGLGQRGDAVSEALAGARGGPVLAMVDYGLLPSLELPPDVHVVAVDPPATPDEAGWLMHRAHGRWLHLAYGDDEIAFALRIAEEELDVRGAASELWRSLQRDAAAPPRPERGSPHRLARGALALSEIGLVAIDAGLVRMNGAGRGDLAAAPMSIRCSGMLEAARRYLDIAETLDLAHR